MLLVSLVNLWYCYFYKIFYLCICIDIKIYIKLCEFNIIIVDFVISFSRID